MNPVIIMIGNVAKNQDIIQKNAADAFLNAMKFNAADMFHSTTVKHAHDMFLNTIVFKNAKCAKNGFAIANANMFQNIIGNIHALNPHAALQLQHVAIQAAAADNRKSNNCIAICCSQVKNFHLTLFLIKFN